MVGILLLLPGLFRDLGQNFPLPLLVEDGQVVLVFIGGHFLAQGHALEKEVQKLVVHSVDFDANIRKFHGFPPKVNLTEPSR